MRTNSVTDCGEKSHSIPAIVMHFPKKRRAGKKYKFTAPAANVSKHNTA